MAIDIARLKKGIGNPKDSPVRVSYGDSQLENPQMIGALGSALIASENK